MTCSLVSFLEIAVVQSLIAHKIYKKTFDCIYLQYSHLISILFMKRKIK